MIRTTYPDRICYLPGCDVRECRVLLPEGVRIGEQPHILLGNLDGVAPDSDTRHSSFHPRKNSIQPTFQLPRLDMSGSSDRISHIRCLMPNGRRGRFNFPGQTCSDPLVALTLSDMHSCSVILKLPDISERLFEIFCFRYLLSKSPNSPCNPPIIGFLSH